MPQITVKTRLKMPFVFQLNSEFLQFLDLYHKQSKVHQDLAKTLMSRWQIKLSTEVVYFSQNLHNLETILDWNLWDKNLGPSWYNLKERFFEVHNHKSDKKTLYVAFEVFFDHSFSFLVAFLPQRLYNRHFSQQYWSFLTFYPDLMRLTL